MRPYPAASAGERMALSYDAAGNKGECSLKAVAGGISELALPARLFGEGIALSVEGRIANLRDVAGERVVVRADEAGEVRISFRALS